MSKYLSAGVYSIEKDLSELVLSIATSSAALVGWSAKGEVDSIRLVTNKQQFLDEYGEPDNTSGNYFHYTALAFLEQGNQLWCLRVEEDAEYGGYAMSNTSLAGTNETFSDLTNDFDTILDSQYSGSLTLDDCIFMILGKDPGTWNSRISVAIDQLVNNEESWDVGEATGVADQIAPAVVDQYTFRIKVYWENDDGDDELVETWIVSRKSKLDGFGKQLYLEDRINDYSDYITVQDNIGIADTVLPDGFAQSASTNLGAGSDGTTYSSTAFASAIASGWDEFANPADVDVRILLNGGETNKTVQLAMKTIAEDRADCFAILDIDYDEMGAGIDDAVTWRRGSTTCNLNSSYCGMYAPWQRINDPYNDVLMYVPPSGYVGAQFAYNDYVAQPWNAPAGFTRGMLNVISMQDIFTKGERDVLYAAQINPLQTFRGQGDIIWGQKTMQVKNSALSRVQVRRLLIILEKSMAVSLMPFVFENNTEITRFRVEAMLNEYLNLLSSQGAFQLTVTDRKGFKVIVDTTNNTPAVIDRNELAVDVFVKPVRTIEFIQLQTIVTTSGASFDELSARGVNL
jgi:hypothetical protein